MGWSRDVFLERELEELEVSFENDGVSFKLDLAGRCVREGFEERRCSLEVERFV